MKSSNFLELFIVMFFVAFCIQARTIFPTGIVSTTGSLNTTTGQSVSMSCDFSGYLPGAYAITWTGPQGAVITTTGRHTITIVDGDGQSQSGGSSPGPSVLSTLTISTVEEMDHGTYYCLMMGNNGAQLTDSIELNILMTMSTGNYYYYCCS